ncbi:MAG: hypothetical protein KC414_12120, partial [Romboutsia sp.]|nr:hypothetical protein [Romboutsia sp.]
MNTDILNLAVTSLKGVGDKTAQKLSSLNISTAKDLLFHLPIRYLDRTKLTLVKNSQMNEYSVIEVKILKTIVIPKPKPRLIVEAEDD